ERAGQRRRRPPVQRARAAGAPHAGRGGAGAGGPGPPPGPPSRPAVRRRAATGRGRAGGRRRAVGAAGRRTHRQPRLRRRGGGPGGPRRPARLRHHGHRHHARQRDRRLGAAPRPHARRPRRLRRTLPGRGGGPMRRRERLSPARLRPRDVLRVGVAGLRARPTRVILSALGIAIGIATMVGVIGVSSSSREDLLRQLDRLGTNLLTVEAGSTLFGGDAKLPVSAPDMVRRIAPVTSAAAVGAVDASVRRSNRIPAQITGGIAVQAAERELLTTLEGRMRSGAWLNSATERYPAVVLGSVAADRLGMGRAGGQVWIGGRWFTVV